MMGSSRLRAAQRVVITGESGFIGTNLVDHYTGEGSHVLNIDIAPPRCRSHDRYWHRQDICDRDELAAVINHWKPDVVLHMAARTSFCQKVCNQR